MLNYNTKYETRYEEFIETNPDKAEYLYRYDFLEIFNTSKRYSNDTDNSNKIVNDDSSSISVEFSKKVDKMFEDTANTISELYDTILNIVNDKDKDILDKMVLKAASVLMSIEVVDGLIILYSFDNLYLTHALFSKIMNGGNIDYDLIGKINSNN